DLLDPARQLADPDVAGAPHFAHFDGERGFRLRDAEQREALRFFRLGERAGLVRAVVDCSLEELSLASAAGAVPATVGDHQVRAHRGGEHGFAVVAGEAVLAGFYGNLERHRFVRWQGRSAQGTRVIRVLLI